MNGPTMDPIAWLATLPNCIYRKPFSCPFSPLPAAIIVLNETARPGAASGCIGDRDTSVVSTNIRKRRN
jgi:hypothetical protein